jgi:drug/metabolite transporter (DMT)-like permease
MFKGIILGFVAYGVFSCGDAAVKALGGHLSIFEIGFFAGLFALFAIPFAKPRGEPWRETFRVRRPGLVILRATTGTTAGILGVFSFTTLPFAEAYSLIFLAPLFATLLSVPLLGERIGWRRIAATIAGFGGVLLVVRPGFRELMPGHLAAVGVAICTAATVLLLRVLGPTESRATLLAGTIALSMTVNGALMFLDFRGPMPADFVWLAMAGMFAGTAQILLMAAIHLAPANRVAPTQYSQVVWAVMLGAIFFREFPDALALVGMALVVASGLVTFLREGPKSGTSIQAQPPRPGGPG